MLTSEEIKTVKILLMSGKGLRLIESMTWIEKRDPIFWNQLQEYFEYYEKNFKKIRNLRNWGGIFETDLKNTPQLFHLIPISHINCSSCSVYVLPKLPKTLQLIECQNNFIVKFPNIPKGLNFITADNNPIEEIINKLLNIKGFNTSYNAVLRGIQNRKILISLKEQVEKIVDGLKNSDYESENWKSLLYSQDRSNRELAFSIAEGAGLL